MLLGGDEFRRTQRGNNNAYCQDNEISWYNWNALETHGDIHRFVQGMIDLRRAHPALRKAAFYTSEEIRWFNPAGDTPAWDDPDERRLACLILGEASEDADLYLIFNAAAEAATFALPDPPDGCCWRLVVDTSASTPEDFVDIGAARELDDPSRYKIGPRASAILVSKA